jgi:hypothetical protein
LSVLKPKPPFALPKAQKKVPPTYTYPGVLGRRKRVMPSVDESVLTILGAYPHAMGEFVAGSDQRHRTYWNQGKRVAHTWPVTDGEPAVWLRLKEPQQ